MHQSDPDQYTTPPLLPELAAPRVHHDQTHPEAYAAFELVLADLPWHDEFVALLARGYTWRKTAWIAWHSQPKQSRQPRTKTAFAELIGVSPGKLTDYSNDPALHAAILAHRRSVLFDHLPDVYDALVQSAADPNYKSAPDRRLALEMAGEYTPRQQLNVGVAPGQAEQFEMTMDNLPYDVLVALSRYVEAGGDAPTLARAIAAVTPSEALADGQ